MALSYNISDIKRNIGRKSPFLSRVSTLARDIDITILSVCLSVRDVPVSDENGLTYRHSFFNHTVAQSF